jgi:purine-nucleoside phosphorylase
MKNSKELTQIIKAAEFLKKNFGRAPKVAIVLGSGLSSFTKNLKDQKVIPMEKLPGGVGSSVVGHKGKFVYGKCEGVPVLACAGRIHGYEGHHPNQIVHNVRALRKWGIKKFVLTNAAGSTKKEYKPGNLVLISDHLNMTGNSPLIGKELYKGPRFPDMSDAYSKVWRKQAMKISEQIKVPLKEGVYGGFMGPAYETAAEVKMAAALGADLVGMSTVWENLALKQMNTEVIGISCVTNYGTGLLKKPLDHKEVIETTKKSEKRFTKLATAIIQQVK